MGYLSNSNGSSAQLCSQEALQAPLQKVQDHFNKALDQAQLSTEKFSKPEKPLLSEIERETLHVNHNYGLEIDEY